MQSVKKEEEMSLTEAISLSSFLKLIKTNKRSSMSMPIEAIQFATISKNEDPRLNEGQDMPIYKMISTPMIPGDLETVALHALYYQGKQKALDVDFSEISTTLKCRHMSELGKTTHIIELGGGKFLPANPKVPIDFPTPTV